MKDKFNLEQDIAEIHNFCDQLDSLRHGILEHQLTDDEIVGALQGIKVLLNLHINKLYDTAYQCFPSKYTKSKT